MIPQLVGASIVLGVGRAIGRREGAALSPLERAGDLPVFSLADRRGVVADLTARRQTLQPGALVAYRQRLRTSGLSLLAEEDGATFYNVTPYAGVGPNALARCDAEAALGNLVLVSLSAVLEPGPLRLVAVVAPGTAPACVTSRDFAQLLASHVAPAAASGG